MEIKGFRGRKGMAKNRLRFMPAIGYCRYHEISDGELFRFPVEDVLGMGPPRDRQRPARFCPL
jgi:hypothetical protein